MIKLEVGRLVVVGRLVEVVSDVVLDKDVEVFEEVVVVVTGAKKYCNLVISIR